MKLVLALCINPMVRWTSRMILIVGALALASCGSVALENAETTTADQMSGYYDSLGQNYKQLAICEQYYGFRSENAESAQDKHSSLELRANAYDHLTNYHGEKAAYAIRESTPAVFKYWTAGLNDSWVRGKQGPLHQFCLYTLETLDKDREIWRASGAKRQKSLP